MPKKSPPKTEERIVFSKKFLIGFILGVVVGIVGISLISLLAVSHTTPPTNDYPNGQVPDGVTQVNTKVVGEAPHMAMGAIFQSLAHSTGQLFENAYNPDKNGCQEKCGKTLETCYSACQKEDSCQKSCIDASMSCIASCNK